MDHEHVVEVRQSLQHLLAGHPDLRLGEAALEFNEHVVERAAFAELEHHPQLGLVQPRPVETNHGGMLRVGENVDFDNKVLQLLLVFDGNHLGRREHGTVRRGFDLVDHAKGAFAEVGNNLPQLFRIHILNDVLQKLRFPLALPKHLGSSTHHLLVRLFFASGPQVRLEEGDTRGKSLRRFDGSHGLLCSCVHGPRAAGGGRVGCSHWSAPWITSGSHPL
mmetsp:Transcript_20452/g.53222  ORF Transcript_20452/g.53222 Transcript_20452/m.53222 type:complete len:220 (+) Transcript_20452:3666-4325(+)